ncbi:acyl-CoA thioesterase [Phaeobacter gallaeciensis]|uniref:Acyl-CoA thioesterase n=2 Tax=Roseobacteraceae TaxID=2854170 RepID=A0A366X658_9RHOB|nr:MULTISPECIES: thioesterase family protein [Roseobacteraceae]MBT3142398.1 acyl-CoA thioesterase [Falsiruegeria litorea]MBT8169374.1 acyl-CoA thioesterase [Falsiruegeria litorea]RBW60603.1 acyl-CoA thioesterase [Phaeobacter gallaeciensis]
MGNKTPITTRSDYAEFYPLQTRWMDNDVYGHMNNVVHYSLFDTAVNGWLIERGLLDPRNSETYGLVVETGCKYYAEMGFPDRVTAGLRVAQLGSSSIKYEVALFRNNEDSATAEGFFTHVYVNRATHRPSKIEDDRRIAFQSLMKEDS